MACDFVATAAFEKDLDDALAYLVYALKSPQAAVNMINALETSIDKITRTPTINAVSCKPTLNALSYREEFVGRYVLLYRIEQDAIVAKRLFHMTQDYERYV